MKAKIFWAILIFAFLAVAVAEGLPHRFSVWLSNDKPWESLLSEVANNQSLPGPLRGPLESYASNLTMDGVVAETNKQREMYGALPLHNNSKLNLAAKAKLEDMFRKQYFEHVSPDGKQPSDVIKASGYDFILVGENLALGNYKNDQVLVEAWMNSPGHRANILDQKFDEIGVAVGKGMYEGREVWMAVQEFGTPMSKCPGPSLALKSNIDANRKQIEQMQSELEAVKTKLDIYQGKSPSQYRELAETYNVKATALNSLIDSTKELVSRYNNQVNDFNRCLEANG